MALFRMDRSYGWTPELMTVAGSFQIPSAYATNNTLVVPQTLTVTAGTSTTSNSYLGPTETLAPLGAKCVVVCNPSSSYGNGNAAPTNTAAGVFLIDLGGFPADIIEAQVDLVVAPTAGSLPSFPVARTAAVVAIDNTNKYVFVASLAFTTGALSTNAGDTIHFLIGLKDTFSL